MKTEHRDTPRGVGASPSLVWSVRRRGGMRQLVVGALLAMMVAGAGQLGGSRARLDGAGIRRDD